MTAAAGSPEQQRPILRRPDFTGGRPRLAIAVRRIDRGRHDATRADPVGIQLAQ